MRAGGAPIEDDTVIVIGSQAILATVPAPAEEALIRSMEADLLPLDDPLEEKADLIDGVLGAGRAKDIEFCDAAAGGGLVDAAVVAERAGSTDLSPAARARIKALEARSSARP